MITHEHNYERIKNKEMQKKLWSGEKIQKESGAFSLGIGRFKSQILASFDFLQANYSARA